MKRLIPALILVCFALVMVPRTSAAASYSASVSAQPASAAPGTAVTFTTSVQSDTTTNVLVDLEVYGPDGQVAFQQFWDNTALSAGQARSLSATWNIPSGAATGSYVAKVGLFSPGWASLLYWNDTGGQLAVASGSSGNGLTANYFDNANLTTRKLVRTDATVNFNWGNAGPASGIGADTFSARWTGQVKARYSESYTFYTVSDDGVRLWVNDQKIIDNWTNHGPTENQGQINLTAGQLYSIKLEYYDNAGGAQIALGWSSPSQARQIVPQSQLFRGSGSTTPTATPVAPTATAAAPTATAAAPTATRVPATATRTPVAPTATRVPATATRVPATATPLAGQYFRTLPPGSALPSDAACAAAVKRRPENKRANATYNATRGNQTVSNLIGGDPRANSEIAARITGNFTGTTDEILQWAACKWGIDEDMVRAQAAIESWWRQDTKGDWTTDASNCAPGHGLGADGRPGECPESFGILQNRYPYEQAAWPGIDTSTAFNADTTYAIWRACYEGYEWWLNDVDQGRPYAAGDAWGCVGRWFAGRWYTQPANDYIGRVQGYLNQRIWEQPQFQEP